MEYFLSFALLSVIYVAIILPRIMGKPRRFALCTLFYAYLCVVLYVTLMPFSLPIPGDNADFLDTVNLVPFIDIILHHGGAWKEVILNTVMTVPFGFFVPLIFKLKSKRVGLFACMGLAFLMSLAIECVQLMYVWSGGGYERIFDITDIIMNTVGSAVGYLLFTIIHPLVSSKNK